jgi:hypothetical protein
MNSQTSAALDFETAIFTRKTREHQLLRGLYHPRHHAEFDQGLTFRLAYHIARCATIAHNAKDHA